MGRRLDPKCKLCRREGVKLYLKGLRCYTAKCAMERRGFPPGMHGKSHQKLSDYGMQLREKQKAKKVYGLLERQFRVFFDRATRRVGATGENLLGLLESRLDNVVFRLGFALSRDHARQLVRHKAVKVNSRVTTIPSYLVRPSDRIEMNLTEAEQKRMKEMIETVTKERPVPGWLSADHPGFAGQVLSFPKRSEIAMPIQEQLIVELYSK